MVFEDSAIPKDLLQELLSLNNGGHLLTDSRQHVDRRHHLPIIIVIMALPLSALLWLPPSLSMLMMTLRASTGFFP